MNPTPVYRAGRAPRAVAARRRQAVETEGREKRSKEDWRICTVSAPQQLSVLERAGNAVCKDQTKKTENWVPRGSRAT